MHPSYTFRMQNLLRNYPGLLALGLIVGTIFFRQTLHENNPYNYSDKRAPAETYSVSFKEVSSELGINLNHRLNYPYPKGVERAGISELLVHNGMPMSIAVTSLNDDDYPDLCFTLPEEENGVKCFINEAGTSFTDVTRELGLEETNPYLPSAILSADFNNDSREDLLIIRYGSHSLYLRTPQNKFSHVKNEWFSNAWGANLYDLNNDGKLDIFFANYYRSDDLTKQHIYWPFTGLGDEKNGASNQIWLNKENGAFHLDNNMYQMPFKARTTSIGLADVNKDNKVDLFEGNDFAVDRFYLQNEKNVFEDKTADTMPFNHHGFSGMNTEFFDLNKDGHLDLNVSNIVTPPFKGLKSLMWIWDPEEKRFEDESRRYRIDRCGYAWTGKFTDFNLDGHADLVVASGFYSTGKIKKSIQFLRAIRDSTPPFFPKEIVPRNVNDLSLVANSRPCLFMREGEEFVDVGETFKELDKVATRSLAIVDFNNDGKMDVIFGTQAGAMKFYRNEGKLEGRSWAGFEFMNKHGSRLNFGVKASLHDETGKLIEYFEFNPANGFRTQNDYRKHVGLGTYQGKLRLTIHGVGNIEGERKYDDIRLNTYNKIQIN